MVFPKSEMQNLLSDSPRGQARNCTSFWEKALSISPCSWYLYRDKIIYMVLLEECEATGAFTDMLRAKSH